MDYVVLYIFPLKSFKRSRLVLYFIPQIYFTFSLSRKQSHKLIRIAVLFFPSADKQISHCCSIYYHLEINGVITISCVNKVLKLWPPSYSFSNYLALFSRKWIVHRTKHCTHFPLKLKTYIIDIAATYYTIYHWILIETR